MAQPIITLRWYLFTKIWLDNGRALGWDLNYSRLGHAMAQSDENRPQDGDLEFYMVMADRCKQLLDSPDYLLFDGGSDQSVFSFAMTCESTAVFGQTIGYTVWLRGIEQEIVWLEYDRRYMIQPKIKLTTHLPEGEPGGN